LGYFTIVFLFLSVNVAMSAVDNSLVLYLTFDADKAGSVEDVSPHQNSGNTKGNPKQVDGIFGSALELDGVAGTIEIPHADSLDMTDAVTIEMWVKLSAAGGADSEVGMEKGGWEAGEYSLYVFYVPGNGSAMQFNDLPVGCADANSGFLGPDLRDDQWHHIAGTWDGEEISVYTDGELSVSVECKGQLGTNKQSIYIGSRTASMRFLKGAVDEVRIYNRALSEAEVNIDMETLGGLSVSSADRLATCWAAVKQLY